MFSAASVCLRVFNGVCQHDNFRTSKHMMMKVGGRCIVQKYRPSLNLGVITPLGAVTCQFSLRLMLTTNGCL